MRGSQTVGQKRNPLRRRRILTGIRLGVVAFVLVIIFEYFILPRLSGARQSVADLQKVNVLFLVIGFALEAGALSAYAQLTHTVLPRGGPRRWALFRVNMSSFALSHVVPGGTAPGTALAYRLLTDMGVTGPDAAFGLAMQGVGSAVVLNLILWLALVISIFLHGYEPLYAVAAGVGVVLLGAFGGVVILLLRGRHWAVDIVRRVADKLPFLNGEKLASGLDRVAQRLRSLIEDKALLFRAIRWAASFWLLDAASLWVFIVAFHKIVSPVDLLVAYGLANVLAVIPVTPAGLGVVESVEIPALIGFGVTGHVATVAVLAYRLVNFWLPIPVGGASFLSLHFAAETGWRQRISAARKEMVSRHPSNPRPSSLSEQHPAQSAKR